MALTIGTRQHAGVLGLGERFLSRARAGAHDVERRSDKPTILPERNLDILRALAVTGVLLDHLLETLGNHAWYVRWLGQAGVQAFFVHTALVLMSSLERDGGPDRTHWIRRFYIRRALRIYPLAWVAITVTLVLHVPALLVPATWRAPGGSAIVANLVLMQDLLARANVLGNLWTLPIELQMYLSLPLCYLIARRRSPRALVLSIGFALIGTAFFLWGTGGENVVPGLDRLRLLRFVPCFLMGVMAYWILRNRNVRPALPAWTWMLIIGLDGFLLYFPWVGLPQVFITSWPARGLFCAILGLAIPFVRDAKPSVGTRFAHTIATYSYGIYLLHPLAVRAGFWLLRDRALPVQWTVFLVTLVASVYAGYHLIEQPGIAFARRIVARGERGSQRAGELEATAPAP